MSQSLFCTLGTEAQVVTTTLYLLRQQHIDITIVRVIHTDPTVEPSRSSLTRIRETMTNAFPTTALESVEIKSQKSGTPLADTIRKEDVRDGFISMYQAIREAKQAGEEVHLCISGGRKVMGVYGMTTAQLLFEPQDKLWYLVSSGPFLDERRMLPRDGDDVALIDVPFLRSSGTPPDLTDIGHFLDPEEAVATLNTRKAQLFHIQLTKFADIICTKAEHTALEALTSHPDWTYKQVSHHLNKSHKTIDAQLRSIVDKARKHFGIEIVTRQTLNRLFASYVWRERNDSMTDNG